MPVSNLATCLGPCILKTDNDMAMIQDSPAINRVLSALIDYVDIIFQVFFFIGFFLIFFLIFCDFFGFF